MKQKKFLLPEGGIPDKWYNILADMPQRDASVRGGNT